MINNNHSTKCNFKNLKTIIFQFYNSSIHSPSYTFSHLLYLISSSMNLFRIHSYPLFNSFVPSTHKKKNETKQSIFNNEPRKKKRNESNHLSPGQNHRVQVHPNPPRESGRDKDFLVSNQRRKIRLMSTRWETKYTP